MDSSAIGALVVWFKDPRNRFVRPMLEYIRLAVNPKVMYTMTVYPSYLDEERFPELELIDRVTELAPPLVPHLEVIWSSYSPDNYQVASDELISALWGDDPPIEKGLRKLGKALLWCEEHHPVVAMFPKLERRYQKVCRGYSSAIRLLDKLQLYEKLVSLIRVAQVAGQLPSELVGTWLKLLRTLGGYYYDYPAQISYLYIAHSSDVQSVYDFHVEVTG